MPHSRHDTPAVVLLSGGLDSATTAAIARAEGYTLYALTVRYGQRHMAEVAAAERVADHLQVAQHAVVDIDLRQFGGSALTDDIPVPKNRPPDDGTIPVTYVPARNTVFLALALAWAEPLGASDIFIGVNAVDYAGYPDCRPEYIEAFERTANLGTKGGVEGTLRLRVHTPLIDLTKAAIIHRGMALGLDYGLTQSCYDPSEAGLACGHCDACRVRLKGFHEAGLPDPARYVAGATTPS